MTVMSKIARPSSALRRALRSCALAALLLAPATAAGQAISPPVTEYTERASSSFQVTNNTITPLVVVLDVRGFVVSEQGMLTDAPLDTARVKVQLSEMSFRLPPRATRTIFYDAKATGGPAWFQVMATFTGARASNGLNLRIELPHVVYLNQRTALARQDVVVRSARYDATAKLVRVELENVSDRLGRVQELVARAADLSEPGGAMPLFPHSRREVTFRWSPDTPPTGILARFDGFEIEAPITR